MEKAIFDTSVWINFIKNNESKETTLLAEYVKYSSKNILLTPTIIQEILQGVRTEAEFFQKKKVLESYNLLKPDWEKTSIDSAKLYFDLRKKGVTIRKSTDCLIAQIAIENDILLVHIDSDFELIAKNSPLRTFQ
jgi:predicted nucleic acid-binding protein